MRKLWPGSPQPLGAQYDGAGVNFALFSSEAEGVELCLFEDGKELRLPLTEHTDSVWHGYLPGAKPGLAYGYRVKGPWDPARGLRFNERKLLFDPYARDVARPLRWDDSLFGYVVGKDDLAKDGRDSAAFAPLARVCDGRFSWGKDAAPRTPWHKTVIYEAHVKGLTKLHPGLPRRARGTYAGLASRPVIEHLLKLGVTAVELMPAHQKVDDRYLVDQGLSNYWGYNTLAYFAPERSFAADPDKAVVEFKRMVRALHAAGLEVILDVVYNHTAEGNQLGPTLSLRGIDNRAYYMLAEDPRYYLDYTGCGHTLDLSRPRTLQLVMDSLRYWAVEMRVDGFRFDLAAALGRGSSAFLDLIHQDPVLQKLKLIAEPWDLGHDGFQVGNFPVGWAEWNGLYRDAVRRFWKGEPQATAELATRLCGSSDLYEKRGRRPYASINFVTCHDGFTLQDLVSYDKKQNEDGHEDNISRDWGTEELRERQKRNLLATLFLSQGVPMLLCGDELGRTQRGNNNAYCHDSELSWAHWKLDEPRRRFLEFVRELSRIRREQPVLRRRKFLRLDDVSWLTPAGAELTGQAWNDPATRSLAIRLAGDAIQEVDERGERISGDSLLILVNSAEEPVRFALPAGRWGRLFDTAGEPPFSGGAYELSGRALALFKAS